MNDHDFQELSIADELALEGGECSTQQTWGEAVGAFFGAIADGISNFASKIDLSTAAMLLS